MKNGTTKILGYKLSKKNKQAKPRSKSSKARASRITPYVPAIMYVTGFLLIAVFFGLFVRHYLLASKTFAVKHILVEKPTSGIFRGGEVSLKERYLGRNIFSVIPSQVETLLRADYPYLKMIRVRRVFPDTIEVDLVERERAAFLDAGGGIVIDRGAMILSTGETPEDLVGIKGVSFLFSRPQPGTVIREKAVLDALGIIESIRKRVNVKQIDLQWVDVSDRSNVKVVVKGVPVNLGADDFEGKIVTLTDILFDKKVDLDGIWYIDLRFRDPVYSYKRK